MSETAQTLIKAALRAIGAYASGETPTSDELTDGLEAMKFMFRHWSGRDIRIPYITQESLTMTGASSYTIGSGGNKDTVRPIDIRGAYVRDSNGVDHMLTRIDEQYYRELTLKTTEGTCEYFWFTPEYPLAKIFPWPLGGSTLYFDSLKPLTDPTLITSTISFPPEYDEAIKWQLALRLCPEYGKEPTPFMVAMATACMNDIETRNFANQIVAVKPEILYVAQRYNVNEG